MSKDKYIEDPTKVSWCADRLHEVASAVAMARDLSDQQCFRGDNDIRTLRLYRSLLDARQHLNAYIDEIERVKAEVVQDTARA